MRSFSSCDTITNYNGNNDVLLELLHLLHKCCILLPLLGDILLHPEILCISLVDIGLQIGQFVQVLLLGLPYHHIHTYLVLVCTSSCTNLTTSNLFLVSSKIVESISSFSYRIVRYFYYSSMFRMSNCFCSRMFVTQSCLYGYGSPEISDGGRFVFMMVVVGGDEG